MELIINFYVTDFCNFNCEHCIHDCGKWRKNHLSPEKFNMAMDILTNIRSSGHRIHTIGITGGEPMCHPNFYSLLRSLRYFKELNKEPLGLELHTNGSIKFKNTDEFNKIFRNVFIGHDDFHRKIKPLSELYLDELTYVSETVKLFRPQWIINGKLVGTVREKGRIVESKAKRCYTKKECMFERIKDNLIFIDFAPDHIRFCGENSHYYEAKENFVKYDKRLINNTDLLLKKALNFVNFHIKEKCKVYCNVSAIEIRNAKVLDK